MVLEALFTGKTSAIIVEVLSEGKALSSKEVYKRVALKAHVTYQAVHKQILVLRKLGVISNVENTRKFLLNPVWLRKVSGFWVKTIENYAFAL